MPSLEQLSHMMAAAMAQALQHQQQLQQQQQQQQPRPTPEASSLRVEFKDFSGEQEDWEEWSEVHLAKASSMGFEEALLEPEERDVDIRQEGFDATAVDAERLRRARQAWTSLITTCKGVALDIVRSAESPSGAWRLVVQHY